MKRIDLLRVAPFFLVALCITAADLSFYAAREPLALGYSLAERTLIAARALWFYAGKLLWPADLAVIYPLWDIRTADPLAWAYAIAAAGLAAVLWVGRSRWGRGPLAGALFFAVTLSPVLGFVDYGYMQFSFVGDRFQYLAGIGLLAVIVGPAVRAASRLPDGRLKLGAGALLVVVLAGLATMTWRQAGIYRDEVTFFGHIVSHNPAARGANHNLGNALLEENRAEQAVAALRLAVEQRGGRAPPPRAGAGTGHRNALQNLAETLRRQQRFEEAVEYYHAALDAEPGFALGHAGLGTALVHLERYEDALESLARAMSLGLEPAPAGSAHRTTGMALHELGRLDEAAAHYERALQLQPGDTEALDRFGMLRFGQKRYADALDHEHGHGHPESYFVLDALSVCGEPRS